MVAHYLERREFAQGEFVCRQGEPSDAIHFIANGSVSIALVDGMGRGVRLRRMTGRTVVGEMGFFRDSPRTASVVADRAATVYVFSRARYEALVADDPALGQTLLEFIVKTLADRLEFANREIAALV